jgi:hypothetical protein
MTGQRTIGRQAETRRFARTRPAKGQRGGGTQRPGHCQQEGASQQSGEWGMGRGRGGVAWAEVRGGGAFSLWHKGGMTALFAAMKHIGRTGNSAGEVPAAGEGGRGK